MLITATHYKVVEKWAVIINKWKREGPQTAACQQEDQLPIARPQMCWYMLWHYMMLSAPWMLWCAMPHPCTPIVLPNSYQLLLSTKTPPEIWVQIVIREVNQTTRINKFFWSLKTSKRKKNGAFQILFTTHDNPSAKTCPWVAITPNYGTRG